METAFVLLNCEIDSEGDTLQLMKAIPEVKEAHRIYGVYDIILRVEADTREDLMELVKKIKQMEKVHSTITMLVV